MAALPPSAADLADFVEASNAIEGFVRSFYGRRSGHRVFAQHLAAAQLVAVGHLSDPTEIHRVLMAGLTPPGEVAGALRRGRIAIGIEVMPVPLAIPLLLAELRVFMAAGPGRSFADPGDFAWAVHHHFEAIHPFSDGNGRVGRLLLQAVRRHYGLPWLVAPFREAAAYQSLTARAVAPLRAANLRAIG